MTNTPAYPLLPYSQLVYDTTKWMPNIYRFPAVLRWRGAAAQKSHIEYTTRLALTSHPVFSMFIDRHGNHYAGEPADIFHTPYYSLDFSIDGDDLIICVQLNRILGDGKSIAILLEDIVRAYNGEPLESDDYWGYLEYIEQHKHSKHYADSKAWLEAEFADTSIPLRPTIDRPWLTTILPPKAGLYTADYTDLREKINQLAHTHFLSADGLFSLCAALAIADYCGTDTAALTWAYEGRERPEEQRIFGSLHRDVPFIIRKSRIQKIGSANNRSRLCRDKNRESAIKFARNQIRSGIAHSDYPYTLTKPHTDRWNYAVNVLRVPEAEEMIKAMPLPIEILPVPPQKYAYALLDIEIHETKDKLQLVYRYSATHYKKPSIEKFAALIRHYAEWLTTDP